MVLVLMIRHHLFCGTSSRSIVPKHRKFGLPDLNGRIIANCGTILATILGHLAGYGEKMFTTDRTNNTNDYDEG